MKKFKKVIKKYDCRFLKFIKKYFEFSKLICYITTVLLPYVSYKVLGLAETAVTQEYSGTLPYLTTMISAVWGGYSTVPAFIINKSKAENKIKIENSYGYEQNPYSDIHPSEAYNDNI